VVLLGIAAQSSADSPIPQYVIKNASPRTGSMLPQRRDTGFPIPLNRSYDRLSDEQKAVVHSWYARIEPGDEPPFPADGLGAIFNEIRSGQENLLVRGELEMIVTVGPSGKATEVQVMKSPNPDMTQFVGSILLLAKYKPAVCRGKPCQMQFPVSVLFDPGEDEDRIDTYVPLNR
jgi:hypothetical protein